MNTEPWGVLLLEKPSKAHALAGRLSEALKLPRVDIIQGLRDERNYILDYLDRAAAERAAAILVQGGVTAVAAPVSETRISYVTGTIRAASLNETALSVVDPDTREHSEIPWASVKGVFAVHREKGAVPGLAAIARREAESLFESRDVRDARLIMKGVRDSLRDKGTLLGALGSVLADVMMGGEPPAAAAGLDEKLISALMSPDPFRGNEDDILMFIMGDDPFVVAMMERSGFNYGYLGERRAMASHLNFIEVVKDVSLFAKPVYVNRAFLSVLSKRQARVPEKVGKRGDRWLRERLLMLKLLYERRVPEEALSVMDAGETLLFYLR